MRGQANGLKLGLLGLSSFHLIFLSIAQYGETVGIAGVLYPNGTPVGGDFINLWTTARLILSERIADIYRVAQFMGYQDTITGGADIGLRLWAYPPHSLLVVWPFGLLGYYVALALWSVAGLIVLAIGARRFGFDKLETAILLTSPATILNLYFGQTGSFATGLLLLALSARTDRDPVSVFSATLLTIKPQAGFLLPLLWAFQRRWQTIAWTAVAVVVFVSLTITLFGVEPWRDYVGNTLPALSALEREGSGPFMMMIPSAFMAIRILTGNSALALLVHAVFAAVVVAVLVVRLWQVVDAQRRTAMVLIATVLMTPYMHNYDLALLLCGALLVTRRWASAQKKPFGVEFLVMVAWAMPHLVVLLNGFGVPLSPLLILPLLFLA